MTREPQAGESMDRFVRGYQNKQQRFIKVEWTPGDGLLHYVTIIVTKQSHINEDRIGFLEWHMRSTGATRDHVAWAIHWCDQAVAAQKAYDNHSTEGGTSDDT